MSGSSGSSGSAVVEVVQLAYSSKDGLSMTNTRSKLGWRITKPPMRDEDQGEVNIEYYALELRVPGAADYLLAEPEHGGRIEANAVDLYAVFELEDWLEAHRIHLFSLLGRLPLKDGNYSFIVRGIDKNGKPSKPSNSVDLYLTVTPSEPPQFVMKAIPSTIVAK